MPGKPFPWVKWSESTFFACPLVPRMSPQARLHLRSIILSSLAQAEPWLVDDSKLWRIADAASADAWAAIREEVLEEFITRDDGQIAHPLALRMAEERIEIAGQRSKAARSRWTLPELREIEKSRLPASASAKAVAEQLCTLNYDDAVAIEDSVVALLDPLIAEKGLKQIEAVTEWLLTAPEAGEFYRSQQFAGCTSPGAIVRSFAKGFDRIAQNALRKAKKPSKSAEQVAAVLSRYGR